MTRNLLLAAFLFMGICGSAQTVVFKEDFNQDSTRSLWTIGDRDGDKDTWEFVNAEEAETPSFTGDFAWSWSWFFGVLTPDNTLMSPKISIPATGNLELSFKVSAADDEEGFFEEHYAVYVIPFDSEFTGSETPVFEETLDGGYFQTAKLVKVDISSFAGQNVKLVFRHYDCTDILYIGLDDVEITQTLLAVSDAQKTQVSIYPNPTSDFLKIQNVKVLGNVRIFDMSGKIVKETSSSDIDVRNLSAGQYILNIYSGNEVISRKFIKK